MRDEVRRSLRIGAFTIATATIFAVAILTIGSRQQLFERHTKYVTSFSNVLGLQPGAPVHLDGVTVGFVEEIELPTDPSEQRINVRFTLQERYTERIRKDTAASIKTLGLLGDKYLELRGGSADEPRVLEGGQVKGSDPAEIAQFVESGEDLVDNLLAISSSLRVILRRVEAGEGLLGELTVAPQEGGRVIDTVYELLASMHAVSSRIEAGEGVLGRLVSDEKLARELFDEVHDASTAVRRVAETIADDLGREDTFYSVLLRDPQGAALLREAMIAMRDGTEALAAAAEELATGNGTLPRLMKDEAYADDFLADLAELVANLRSAAEKLDRGEGSAGALLNDPQLYQDIENVVRGVKDSTVVSWFIRNRRKKGEELVAEEAAAQSTQEASN